MTATNLLEQINSYCHDILTDATQDNGHIDDLYEYIWQSIDNHIPTTNVDLIKNLHEYPDALETDINDYHDPNASLKKQIQIALFAYFQEQLTDHIHTYIWECPNCYDTHYKPTTPNNQGQLTQTLQLEIQYQCHTCTQETP